MKFIWQSFWHTSAVRDNDSQVRVRTFYSDSGSELAAVMVVNVSTLEIDEAYLEFLGAPGGMSERRQDIPELIGIKAYLGSGPELRAAFKGLESGIGRLLFNENVVAMVQAETFLFPERGYASAGDYSQAWEKFYLGSCRYYSNLDRVQSSWGDYIGHTMRKVNLFDRFKSQQLYEDEENIILTGTLVDSFHHISTWLAMDHNYKVKDAKGSLLRCPDKVCQESASFMANLPGKVLPTMSKKELAQLMGTSQGCIHLIDIIYDGITTIKRKNGEY